MNERARHLVLGTPCHETPKTVVILGAPRGGTSMVAGVVRELGIDLGSHLGINHEDARFLPKDVATIRQRIEERNRSALTWGWKMPHSIDYIDEIEKDLRNPHFIFVFRNLLGVALSQQRHSGADISVALSFSARRIETMLARIAALTSPMLLVEYEAAVSERADFVNTMGRFLGVAVDAEMQSRAASFIDPVRGYRPITAQYFRVGPSKGAGKGALAVQMVWRHLRPGPNSRTILRDGDNPGFILAPEGADHFPARMVVSLTNISETARRVRFVFDYEGRFSRSNSQLVEAGPGASSFLVETSGRARRICVIPEMVGDTSAITDLSVHGAA